ncbi:MAG: heme exporter protein CcmB [Bacteroidota bacterium]
MKELFLLQIRIEIRKKSVIASLILYLACLVFINYFALGFQGVGAMPVIWSALFWMVLLSTLVSVIAKSFAAERSGSNIYLYSLASPAEIILSKIVYGFLLCCGICLIGFIFFGTVLSNPIQDTPLFLLTLVLASFGFSASLSVLSAIASKTNNSSAVMAILSFPVIVGILLNAIKLTKNCIDGLDRSVSVDELITMAAINIMVTSISYLLFPYIWRS